MVSALDRKLLRDVVHMSGQLVAIAMIVASAVATYVTMRGALDSLVASREAFYRDGRFAEVFATLKRAPEAIAARIAAIPGVALVQTRVVADVVVDLPGLNEPATAHIVSLPDRGEPTLNAVFVRGQARAPLLHRNEVLMSEAFATANNLQPGDDISAIVNGRWMHLRIAGIAISPEFIYEQGSSTFPDNRRYGVLWMSREQLAAAYGMTGAFNDVALTLAPGTNPSSVIDALDRLLGPYGSLGAGGRDEQISSRFIDAELKQMRISATVLPAIFLFVAAFLIHIVLARLVASQRDQIAILKAFGYSRWPIVRHYLGFALSTVVAGSIIGVALGYWLGIHLTQIYTAFYRFPRLVFRLSGEAIAVSVFVSAFVASVGAIGALRAVLALPPAEGMRGETPQRFGANAFERSGLHRLVSAPVRMILRNIERRPLRTLMTVISIALSVAILVVGRFVYDSVTTLIDVQFRTAQIEDASVSFDAPESTRAARELARLPGVVRVEPFRSVAVRVRHGARSRRVPLTGLDESSQLRRILDSRGREAVTHAGGAVMTAKLASLLDAKAGDPIDIEVLEGERTRTRVVIAATVDELIGTTIYLPRREVNRLLHEGNTMSGANLAVEREASARLYETLKRMPSIRSVDLREAMLQSFRDTVMKNHRTTTATIVLFACVIAVGMIYNSSRIALSERGRDLASLRVLGFTKREVGVLLLGEQAMLTLVAIPIGFAAGYGLVSLIAALYETDLYRIPLTVSPFTWSFAFWVVVAAAALSGFIVQRRIARLDLVAVLKTRE